MLKLFRINDGETHHYIAEGEAEARELHAKALDDYGVPLEEHEGEEWSVAEVSALEFLRINFDDGVKPTPAGYTVERDGRIMATAQAWIEWQGAPGLLCSSMF